MNSDPLSLFNGVSGAKVFVTTTSFLPNGHPGILEVHIFNRERMGILVLVITSLLSLIAASGLLFAIASSWWNTRKSKDPHLFVRTGVAPYFVSMLICDVFQSIGSIMNARWVQSSSVNVGGFCTSQAVIKHIADVGVAIWALVIAFHTFLLLFFGVTIPKWAVLTALVGANGIIILLVCLGPTVLDSKTRGPFYGISGYWCWIADEYETERITMDYMIMFLSAVLSFVLYTLVFLRMRGNIVVNGLYIRFRLAKNKNWRGRLFAQSYALKIARQMLLYPVAYTVVILPIAVARFCEWSGRRVPFTVTIFSDTVFLLSGVVNVLLFCATRRILPAQSVVPGWRGLFRLSGFTVSNPSQDTDKSFACRGTERRDLEKGCEEDEEPMSPRSQLDLLDDPHGPQVRIKIDNHVDNTLQSGGNRDSMSNIDRYTVPTSQLSVPQRPLPALVKEERRKSMTSEISELTMAGEGRSSKA